MTLAAGLATEGMKPVCAIYSTFLQRGFDQIVHDVALQRLPVRFAIDRAGLVGQDGATHAGSYDLGYMAMLPGMVVMAPSDAAELRRMVATAIAHDDGPIAFRYPRGEAAGADQPGETRPLEIGKGRLVREGRDVAILSLGATPRGLRLQAAATARGAGPLRHRRGCPLLQAARYRNWWRALPAITPAGHGGGWRHRRLRHPCAAAPGAA